MQTFLTHRTFGHTAVALDDARLRKQCIEAWQTFNQLTLGSGGYPNHPINNMWRYYEFALAIYGMEMCRESSARGFRNETFNRLYEAVAEMQKEDPEFVYEAPPWMGDMDVMRSHRSNLIRKQEEGTVVGRNYIKEFGAKTPRLWPYLWPVIDDDDPSTYILRVSNADLGRLGTGERLMPPDDVCERVDNL